MVETDSATPVNLDWSKPMGSFLKMIIDVILAIYNIKRTPKLYDDKTVTKFHQLTCNSSYRNASWTK